MALAARPIDIVPWLFCTKRGEGYFNEETGQASGVGLHVAALHVEAARIDEDSRALCGARPARQGWK